MTEFGGILLDVCDVFGWTLISCNDSQQFVVILILKEIVRETLQFMSF